MRIATTLLVILTILPVDVALTDVEDGPPPLAHNPFSRPPSETLRSTSPDPGRDGLRTELPELRVTMIGSVKRLANVGGRIVKRGDEVQGYVLVAIHEQYAVLRRNGENVTVYVKPLAEDDE